MTQVRDLAKPFAARLIKQPPSGKYGQYVPHDIVLQKLLAVLGPVDFEITELVRGPDGRIEGCLARLTCEIDGRRTTIVEVGDCENPDNWKTEGGRMKDAASDAFKRCAMRIGCGLHLWSGQDFFLFDFLDLREEPQLPLDTLDPTRPFTDDAPDYREDAVRAIVEASDEERMGQEPMTVEEARALVDDEDDPERPFIPRQNTELPLPTGAL